ncbi:MAG: ArsR/SmtB family transcription factor [Nitrosopumilus sp.]|uniref:ArsR/SmtB family transcription factor n=1 Tax=Nitrosopumilus sp. TaxID=2024843 RepID=UPI00292FEBA3|nr:winged helix-turn-helix domain-containing protein [Nitrosopumilus sp.]
MKAITIKTLKTNIHPQTKALFYFLFVGSRGGDNRIRIMSTLRENPSNANQIAAIVSIDYKSVQHHIKVLEKNNMVSRIGGKYGATYFVSALFEEGQDAFDEILSKLQKSIGT